jgi:hypothetical protein
MEQTKISYQSYRRPATGPLGNPNQFKDTPRPKKMGRPPGSPNKRGHTLMTLVMQAAEELRFLRKDDTPGDKAARRQLVEGEGGTLGYLKWMASTSRTASLP